MNSLYLKPEQVSEQKLSRKRSAVRIAKDTDLLAGKMKTLYSLSQSKSRALIGAQGLAHGLPKELVWLECFSTLFTGRQSASALSVDLQIGKRADARCNPPKYSVLLGDFFGFSLLED